MHRFDVQSSEQQAEKVATENYRELQAEVIGTVRHRLSSRKMLLDESDLEEAYCQAWHGVCETIKRGTPVSNLTGMLIEITWRRAVDLYRELRPSQRVDLQVEEPIVDLDVDAQLDDQIKLKRFIAQVRGRLNPRECEAVSLCVIHGYSRPEAAKLMGLQRRQMEKLMDGATKKIGGVVASITTRGCGGDEWARLMRSYALGLIAEDDRDYPRAAEHVSQCAACRRYVNGLRGLAAILPPVLPFGPVTDAGHSAGILTHLERLFRNSHNGGMTSAGSALRTTSAGATGSAGGGSLASSLSTGTIAKGVAVLAAGTAALAFAAHGGKTHRLAARRTSPTQIQTQIPAITSASAMPPAASPSGATAVRQDSARVRTHHSVARRRTHMAAKRRADEGPSPQGSSNAPERAGSELGNEDVRYSPAPATTPAPREESSNSSAVNREFGWER
jgi:DNA-directed RNA polymerase specialized sigma24 family protein